LHSPIDELFITDQELGQADVIYWVYRSHILGFCCVITNFTTNFIIWKFYLQSQSTQWWRFCRLFRNFFSFISYVCFVL